MTTLSYRQVEVAHRQELTGEPLARLGLECVARGVGPPILLVALQREVWCGGRRVLSCGRSKIMYGLLEMILRGEHADRGALYSAVWGQQYRPPSSDNALYVAISRLRDRIGDEPLLALEATEGGAYVLGTRRAVYLAREAEVLPDSQLPPVPGPLLGRRDALAELTRVLADKATSVVTVLGPPGVGKTHLVLAVGAKLREERAWAGELLWCPLAAQRTLEDAVESIADSLGVVQPSVDHIERALAGPIPRLLLLDGAGHLEGLADTISRWAEAAPSAVLLVTSVRPLGLPGERVVVLEPLEPAAAAALFVSQLERLAPGATADSDLVLETVERLDRLPVVVKLAAARAALLPRSQWAMRLTGGGSALEQALQRSWNLLPSDAQHSLACLALVPGDLPTAVAEAVMGGDIAALERLLLLVRHSLVQRSDDGRVCILECIRAFALERLPPDARVSAQGRLVEWALSMTGPALQGPPTAGHHALQREARTALRLALRWARDLGRHEAATLLLCANESILTSIGRKEVFGPLLEASAALSPSTRIRLHHAVANDLRIGGAREASEHLDVAAALLPQVDDESRERLAVTHALFRGLVLWKQQPDTARQVLEAALPRARAAGFPFLEGNLCYTVGGYLQMQGDLEGGESRLREALALFRWIDHDRMVGLTLYSMASGKGRAGDMVGALDLLDAAEPVLMRSAPQHLPPLLRVRAHAFALLGKPEMALAIWEEVLALLERQGEPLTHADPTHMRAGLLLELGRLDAAEVLLQSTLRLADTVVGRHWLPRAAALLAQARIIQGLPEASRALLDEHPPGPQSDPVVSVAWQEARAWWALATGDSSAVEAIDAALEANARGWGEHRVTAALTAVRSRVLGLETDPLPAETVRLACEDPATADFLRECDAPAPEAPTRGLRRQLLARVQALRR